MHGFTEFIEMTDAVQDPPIRLKSLNSGKRYRYDFTIPSQEEGQGDSAYVIEFHERSSANPIQPPPFGQEWAVTLTGPRGYHLTGLNVATRVYREVIRAFKAVMERANPDVFVFNGYTPDQRVMYKSLYERFLKPYYRQINHFTYLRNDLYLNYKQKQDQRWNKILNMRKDLYARNREIKARTLQRQQQRQYHMSYPKNWDSED